MAALKRMSSTRKAMIAALAVMAAAMGVRAQGDGSSGDYTGAPFDQFVYSSGLQTSAAQLPGPLFLSPDACRAGNGGLRGLSFDGCLNVCLNDPSCKVASFFPTWFGGSSACFAYSGLNADTRNSATLDSPQAFTEKDVGAFTAVKKEALGWPFNSFTYSTGLRGVSPAQLPGPIFVSSDSCKSGGNAGVRGLTHAQCLKLCLSLPDCQVSSFYPVWFKGPSACFAYNTVDQNVADSATSEPVVPVSFGDSQRVYLAVLLS